MEKHKCADCGFLATRNRESSNLDAMEQNYRNTGKSPQKVGFSPPYDIYEAPICLMQVSDLWNEIGKFDAKNIHSAIQKDRLCEVFRQWQQGFTPKEHREMMDRERMLKWQAEREDVDKKWREDQRRSDLEWREKQEKEARSRHRWDLIITGIIATLLISAATIGAALITVKWGK